MLRDNYRHNPDPNFCQTSYSSHKKIFELVGENKKVLDVGCSGGYLGREFKKRGCFVVGIERDSESAKKAEMFCDEVLNRDVESIDQLKYADGYFDVLVFADVLEHLRDPERVLEKFKKYLNPAGFIVASIPNIARIDIRWKLLCGRFDYEEKGIMDRTHVRFFTLVSAKRMFEKTGYRIRHIDYTGIASKFKLFPTYLAFQFIFIATKN